MKMDGFFKDRRNMYFIAVIAAVLLTVGGLWQYKNYIDEKNAQLQYEEEVKELSQENTNKDVGLQIVKEIPTDDKAEDNSGVKEVTNLTPKKIPIKKVQEKTIPAMKTEEPNMQTIISPVFGTVCMDYADESLVYSKTQDAWIAHFGLDIKADEGTSVRAAMDGVISQVVNDAQWGLSITINHGGDVKTRYCNLSTLDMVKVGQKVNKGDVISGIGKSALAEISDDPHLHFEVLKGDKYLDPKAYLPKQSIKR